MSDYYGVDTSYRNAANETDVPRWSDEEKKALGIKDDEPLQDGTDAHTGVESYVEPEVQEEQIKKYEEAQKAKADDAAKYDGEIKSSETPEEAAPAQPSTGNTSAGAGGPLTPPAVPTTK